MSLIINFTILLSLIATLVVMYVPQYKQVPALAAGTNLTNNPRKHAWAILVGGYLITFIAVNALGAYSLPILVHVILTPVLAVVPESTYSKLASKKKLTIISYVALAIGVVMTLA